MEKISLTLSAFFIATQAIVVWQFYRASNKSKKFLLIIFIWMAIQFLLGRTDFYANETTIPPRFILLFFPPFILIILLFVTIDGRKFINSLNLKHLTLLHTIRIPVEIILYYLFIGKSIPQIMTFEGRNFDIVAGLTAPIIFYFSFIKNKISDKLLIFWNVLCLALLINIIIIALLSVKTPFQQFAFEQPNIALGYFPFNWLPSVIVPIILLSHLVAIRQLVARYKKNNS